jgi:hypothetical protein
MSEHIFCEQCAENGWCPWNCTREEHKAKKEAEK